MVAIPFAVGKRCGWLSLRDVYDGVKRGVIDLDGIPDFPIVGRGYYRADQAYIILCERRGIDPDDSSINSGCTLS